MKTADLTDHKQIDALVAMAQGWGRDKIIKTTIGIPHLISNGDCYCPSSGNAQTYELIEKFLIEVGPTGAGMWFADYLIITSDNVEPSMRIYGPTSAIAICKAVIASVYGDVIPDEIMEKVR